MRLTGTRIWITGASSGIGQALAQAALAAGAKVAAGGRREEALATLRPPPGAPAQTLLPLAFDIRDAAAAQTAAAKIKAAWGGLDWAIANAGDCEYMQPPAIDHNILRRMMEINYYGAAHTADAALPLLADAGGRGLFAAIASAAALAPLPRGCAYGASKAALAYFTQSLRGHYPAVDFSVVYPGFVKTPLTDKNDFPMPALVSAEQAARIILRGLARRRSRIVFPRRLIFALQLLNRLPARLQQTILAGMARHES